MGGSHFCRGDDFSVGGADPAVANVFHRIGGENDGVLRHDADGIAQGMQIEIFDVDAIEFDAALLRIVKAQQQLEQGSFAGAGRADHGDGLTRADV